MWGKVRREGWGRRPHLRTPRPAHKSGSARATACGREVVFTPHCTPPAGPQLGGPGQAVVEVEAAAGLPGAQGGPVVRRGSSAWGSCTGCGGCGRAAMCQELRHGGERERRLQPPHAQTPEGLRGRPTPLPPPQQAGPLTLSHGFLPAEDSGANQSQRPGHGTHREYRQSCDVFAASPPRPREHPLLLNVTQLGQGSAAGARSARLPRLPWGRRARPIAAAPQVLRAQLVAAPPRWPFHLWCPQVLVLPWSSSRPHSGAWTCPQIQSLEEQRVSHPTNSWGGACTSLGRALWSSGEVWVSGPDVMGQGG